MVKVLRKNQQRQIFRYGGSIMFASMYFLVFEKKTFLHEAVVVVNNQPTNHACIPPQFFKTGG
jgi:hypothetical protein